MICMILAKNTNNSEEIHVELMACLLHVLDDEKSLINDLNDYYVVNEMFKKINRHLVGENLSRLLARFQARNSSVRQKKKNKIQLCMYSEIISL